MKHKILFILCICIALLLLVSCTKQERPLTAAELLDLGEKYLLEMNYEQALIQFITVIEIEPMNPRGYTGAAEAYIGLGETDKAIVVLRDGLKMIPDNVEIQRILDSDLTDMQSFLYDILMSYETGGYESIYTAVETAEYQELAAQISEFPVIYVDNTEKYGIGLYNSGEFIYIGGYEDRIRSGFGFWIRLNNLQKSQYRFEGEWKNDKPNGLGTDYSFFSSSSSETFRSGMLIEGLWDGKVIIKGNYFKYDYWTFVYSKGKYVVLGAPEEDDDGLCYPVGYVEDDTSNFGYDSAENIELLHGIVGFYENP